jgi:high affinity sulfate transporter 1
VSAVERWLPGLAVLRRYDRRWLRRDLVAGMVLSAMLVPAGMGYATAAGLPPVTGLYATVVPLVVYALVGPNRVLVYGPDSALSPMILAVVVVLAADGVAPVATAGTLAVVVGGLCVVASALRVGTAAELLSRPIRYGYLNGIAVTVIVLQAPKLLGFSTDADTALAGVVALAGELADGALVPAAAVLSLVVVTGLLVVRRVAPVVPGALLALVAAGAASAAGVLDGVPVVGDLPSGLPRPGLSWDATGHLADLVAAAVGIALVAFADTSVLSRTWSARLDQGVDPNVELRALGLVNVAAGALGGFPVSSSASRTPVAVAAGARTQVTGLVGAAVIAVMLLAVPAATRHVPVATLAAVVVVAVLALVEIRPVWELRRVDPWELVVSVVCFTCVVTVGVLAGILVSVALSLALFVRRAWRPYSAELVRVPGLKGYHDASRHPEGERVPGLVLFRFDAPLFFANADHFRAEVLALARRAGVRRIVLTAEPITDVDATAVEILTALADELEAEGVELRFAELKGVVRDKLERVGLVPRVGAGARTVGAAVRDYATETGVAWRDWEDEAGTATGTG